jgi:hypothetical protein
MVKESVHFLKVSLPQPPPNRLILESDGLPSHLCPRCGSSLKRKYMFFRTKKCIQPLCSNYFGEK